MNPNQSCVCPVVIFIKSDIGNHTRNGLAKVSSNTIISRSAGTTEATNRSFYLYSCSNGGAANEILRWIVWRYTFYSSIALHANY
jgi:hypothetical protein